MLKDIRFFVDKFSSIGKNGAQPLIKAGQLRDDLNIFVIIHEEEVSENFKPLRQMKTIGKMVSEKLTMEGLFTIVLFTDVKKQENGSMQYRFVTNTDGTTTAKSPEGMFDLSIPNDLNYVVERIANYYNN